MADTRSDPEKAFDKAAAKLLKALRPAKAKSSRLVVNSPLRNTTGIIPRGVKRKRTSASSARPNNHVDTATSEEALIQENLIGDDLVSDIWKKYSQLSDQVQDDHDDSELTDWQKRKLESQNLWETQRQSVVDSLLANMARPAHEPECGLCANPAKLRCLQCQMFMCEDHDKAQHLCKGCHDRESFHLGFYYPLPTEMPEDNPQARYPRDFGPKYCSQCANSACMALVPGVNCILIAITGRYDLHLPNFICEACGYKEPLNITDLISQKLWPSLPKITQNMYIFETGLLETFHTLKCELPGTSVRGFLETLNQISRSHSRKSFIVPTAFTCALREWQRCSYELDKHRAVDHLACPACADDMHACHVDGNRKLYRFDITKETALGSGNYYRNVFIDSDAKVDSFVKEVQDLNIEGGNGACGDSHWKAAKARSKTMKKQSETGLAMICCRHGVLLKAINMFQGEIFPYPLYLHLNIARRYKLNFLCQDVICKYYPWLQKLLNKLPPDSPIHVAGNQKPFLSVMHGKAHGWDCQITYGGRWQDGSCAQSGEEQEMVNQYMSRAGFTTRTMTKTGREEQLTLHAFHWNRKKLLKLPQLFQSWIRRAEDKVKELSDDLVRSMASTSIGPVQTDTLKRWYQDLKKVAQSHRDKQPHSDLSPEEQLYQLHTTLSDDRLLSGFASSRDPGQALLSGTSNLVTQAAKRVLTPQLRSSMKEKFSLQLRSLMLKNSTSSESELVRQGKILLAKRSITSVRQDVELTMTCIMTHKRLIEKEADSSKRRTRHRTKLSAERQRLSQLMTSYNCLATILRIPFLNGVPESQDSLPWLQGAERISLKEKRALVEQWLHLQRYREERRQLANEVNVYLTSLKSQQISLMADINQLQSSMETESTATAGKLAILQRQHHDINMHERNTKLAIAQALGKSRISTDIFVDDMTEPPVSSDSEYESDA